MIGRVTPLPRARELHPVLMRMQASGFRSPDLAARVEDLGTRFETLPAKTVLQEQDAAARRPRYVLSGWACRFRHLSDRRRQIFDFVLPGEGVGVCLRPNPLASTTTIALTAVKVIDASPLVTAEAQANCEELILALQAQADADERRTLDQIVRLGRLTALERLAHLLLSLHQRLQVIGQADGDRFPLPLTQEVLADMTGLSVVHVNRTIQELRRQGLASFERGSVRLLDRAAVARIADYASLDPARA